MGATEKIKNFCFKFATFGALGEWWLGGVVASVFAIPSLLFFQSVYWFSHKIFYWFLLFCAILFFIVIQYAIYADPEKAPRTIVLDKVIGVMIALAGVPLRWRVIIFGFLMFHVLNTLKPFFWYRKVIRRVERVPGILGVLGADVLSAALVNVFLHTIAWVMG